MASTADILKRLFPVMRRIAVWPLVPEAALGTAIGGAGFAYGAHRERERKKADATPAASGQPDRAGVHDYGSGPSSDSMRGLLGYGGAAAGLGLGSLVGSTPTARVANSMLGAGAGAGAGLLADYLLARYMADRNIEGYAYRSVSDKASDKEIDSAIKAADDDAANALQRALDAKDKVRK